MYRPSAFAEDDPAVLAAAMNDIGFASLVTHGPAGLMASEAPVLVEADRLRLHLARANPQAAALAAAGPAGLEALMLFQGPAGYVSPGWYPSKAEHGKVVPTWNYVAIHVRGRARAVEEPEAIRAIIDRLTARHEAGRAEPWSSTDAPPAFIAGLVGAIIGVEVTMASVEGKWKLSQNRPRADQAGVLAGLAASDDPRDQALHRVMSSSLGEAAQSSR